MPKLVKAVSRTTAALLLVITVMAFFPSAQAQAATSFSDRYSLLSTAYKYLGTPYVFGATGPRAFDCSGFAQYVYRLHGYYIPRTAASQSTVGRYVQKSELRVGDLMFYRNTYKLGISHVGIYAGNGRIIHAFPKLGVTVSSIYHPYLASRYAGAKRILR